MINITKAILHTMDSETKRYYNAQQEMYLDIPLREYIMKHTQKAMLGNDAQKGTFKLTSKLYESFSHYDSEQFVSLSRHIADLWFGAYMEALRYLDMNLLFVEFTMDDCPYFGAMQFKNKNGYIRSIEKEDGIIRNEILTYASLLPSLSQNVEEFFFVNLQDHSLLLKEYKRYFTAEEELLLSDQILYCDVEMSMKDSLKTLDNIITQVSNELFENPLDNTLKVKRLVKSCVETDQQLDVDKICPVAFPQHDTFEKKFKEKAMETHLPKTINLKAKTPPGVKKHKIKTDMGIEINIPVDLVEQEDTFEIIQNSDESVTITLHHIGKIIDK